MPGKNSAVWRSTPARNGREYRSTACSDSIRTGCTFCFDALSSREPVPTSLENALRLVEPVECMQRAHRQFGIGGVDQHRELDLGGGDGADVDIALGQRLESLRRHPGMAAHAAADHRNLGDVGGAVEPRIADFAL